MGTHSNYLTTELDFNTVIFICISIIVGIILYFTFKLITHIIKRHYYKQFSANQHRVEQYKRIKAQKERAYQNTINNFINNRIAEDMENNKNPLSSSAQTLISLYKGE